MAQVGHRAGTTMRVDHDRAATAHRGDFVSDGRSRRWEKVRPILGGVLALAAAMGIGRFAFTPILPAMQAEAGLDAAQAGLLASANYAGYLVGALAAGVAVPTAARPGVLLASAVLVALTTALMAIATGMVAWGVIRFAAGVASAGVFVLASGLVLEELRRTGRAAASGWLFSGVGLGIVVSGAVVGATVGALGWRGSWLVLSLLAAAAILPAWGWTPRPAAGATANGEVGRPPVPDEDRSRGVARPVALGLLFAAYFLEGVGYIVTGTFLVAIVEEMPGLRGTGVWVWIVAGLAVIPSAALWSLLAGRIGFARALVAAYALQAVGVALPLVGGAGAAFASAVLFGGTFAGITALTLTLAGFLSPGRAAGLVGLLTAVFGIGQVIGPVAGGALASNGRGFGPALVAAAMVLVVAAGLAAALAPNDPSRRLRRSGAGHEDAVGRAG